MSGDEFLEKLQPSETRQNKTIKKQTFSLSTRHSDVPETGRGRETGRQATRECHYSVGDIICPSTRAAFLPLSCSALHFDNGLPSGYALNFWLALPYPNWLTTHKQTASSPLLPLTLSTTLCLFMLLPTLEGSSCCDYRAISLAGNDNSLLLLLPLLLLLLLPAACRLPAARVVAFDVTC